MTLNRQSKTSLRKTHTHTHTERNGSTDFGRNSKKANRRRRCRRCRCRFRGNQNWMWHVECVRLLFGLLHICVCRWYTFVAFYCLCEACSPKKGNIIAGPHWFIALFGLISLLASSVAESLDSFIPFLTLNINVILRPRFSIIKREKKKHTIRCTAQKSSDNLAGAFRIFDFVCAWSAQMNVRPQSHRARSNMAQREFTFRFRFFFCSFLILSSLVRCFRIN